MFSIPQYYMSRHEPEKLRVARERCLSARQALHRVMKTEMGAIAAQLAHQAGTDEPVMERMEEGYRMGDRADRVMREASAFLSR